MEVFICCKADAVKQNSLLFISGFSFRNIYYSQDSRGIWVTISLHPFCHFHSFYRHLDINRVIAAESSPLCKPGNLWFPNEFHLYKLTLVAVVVGRMIKTRVTLRNISGVLLNLIKRLIFAMFKVYTFVPLPYLFC